MFAGLWPDVPVDEVPIGSITNGVHAHTWVAPRHRLALQRRRPPGVGRRRRQPLGRRRQARRRRRLGRPQPGRSELVSFVRARLGDDLLDPDALTIGFARRFATYKRATLLLAQPDRLRALLLDADRPVQFVFAGKAHPADEPGKEMIQRDRAVRPPARTCAAGSCSWPTTTWPSPGCCTTAATSG